jgi:hypothetical protein
MVQLPVPALALMATRGLIAAVARDTMSTLDLHLCLLPMYATTTGVLEAAPKVGIYDTQ